MGGVFDGGISIDTKNSPRHAAIERAQAELRLEYDVREERRRELEFLERGGNPLDFRFGPPTSASVQSTSLADHLHENEARGSFAEATSAHGDSVESSGRPGTHSIREPNMADNLMLLDGAHSSFNEEKAGARVKRKKISPLSQTTKRDVGHKAKNSEESSILRLSVKSQAYARRNRSKSSRDNARVSTTTPSKISILSSSQPNQSNNSRPIIPSVRVQINDNDSTICKLKPSDSYENDATDALVSENHLASDAEGIPELQTPELHTGIIEAHEETKPSLQASENLLVNDKDRASRPGDVQTPLASISVASGVLVKEKIVADDSKANQEREISKSGEIQGFGNSSKRMGFQNESVANGKCTAHLSTDTSARSSSVSEPSQIKVNSTVDAISFQSFSKEPSGGNNEVINETIPVYDTDILPCMISAKENGNVNTVDSSFAGNTEPSSVLSQVSNKQTQLLRQHGESNDAKISTYGFTQCETSDGKGADRGLISQSEKKFDGSSSHAPDVHEKASCDQTTNAENVISSFNELTVGSLSKKNSTASEVKVTEGNDLKMERKLCEDAILKDARAIEAKRRGAKEAPVSHFLLEKHIKSHWDYVLEEMAWLANDFMQERLWKITVAAQVCHEVAATGQSILENKVLGPMQRQKARALAHAVKGFWHFAEKNKGFCEDDLGNIRLPIQRYAIRLLQSNGSLSCPVPAEAPRTPDRISDGGIMSWKEHILDESTFYKVPFGAMQAYRESMEAYWLHHESFHTNMHQLDCEASVGDSGTELKNQGSTFEDDEDESTMYNLPKSFETNKLLDSSPKKTKGFQKKSGAYRPQGTSFDAPYISSLENRSGNNSSLGKRPSPLNVGLIPTKRVRTATRQRLGPFGASATGLVQMTSKTDASSGDTNSFQDEESSLHGFPQKKNAEVESTMDFDKQMPFGGTEVSIKPKKKKAKYLGCKPPFNSTDCGGPASLGKSSSYDKKWQMDPLSQLDQVDVSKRKLEGQLFEPNGPCGPYVSHAQKKPKMLKQLSETSLEAVAPNTRPLPSPVASQMSNMSNSNKLIKVIQGRDRGKKNKGHKGASGQLGSSSAWSQFEDQALVVLVHDMGPNWELVCDAINSTLQFKCIFRKPKECKERHKVLMDKSAGDGADSAEDSGSSQHYPSTLPGIPKGSARQLFQRLQGPLEEDTIKAHFEKIIVIGQRLQPRRSQKVNQDPKQTNPVHSSHFQALSQACPNNLAGGLLTPLDLCDAITPNPDALLHGYQGPHSNGIGLQGQQGSPAPTLPVSCANSLLQGPPGIVMGNSFPSPSGPSNPPVRDATRSSIPRSTSVSGDDPQRLPYNPVIPNRAVSAAYSGGAERVRLLPGGNGVGMVCGVNLGMPVTRPGFQGIGSTGVLNMVPSSNMLSSNGVGMPNIHHGSVTSHGGSTMRSRESLQPRTFPVQQQQSHQIPQVPQQPHMHGNPHHPHIHGSTYPSQQQQAYAMRIAKERQQRLLQQQSFSGSTAVQGSSQQPSQPSSPLPPISPSHSQHKQHTTQNPQNSASLPNQMMKQRRQQLQQQQPRQQSQQQQPPQQQAKLMKGAGRGGVLMHQNLPVDASFMNGPSTSPGNQVLEKHMMQRQAFYPGTSGVSGSNSALPQPGQQKMYRAPPQSPKVSPIITQTDNSSSGQAQVPPDQQVPTPQPSSASSQSAQNPQQRQPIQPHQTMHRVVLQQSRQLTENPMASGIELAQTNQMRPTTAVPQSVDSANALPDATPASLSSSHWKQERSLEASAPAAPTTQMASSPQSSLVGNVDTLMPSSGQGLIQRQFSGSLSVHGNGSSAWQPQQQLQSQQLQQQQPPPPPLTHHRHAVQGAIYGRPSPNP